jgi:hypothetical protein
VHWPIAFAATPGDFNPDNFFPKDEQGKVIDTKKVNLILYFILFYQISPLGYFIVYVAEIIFTLQVPDALR